MRTPRFRHWPLLVVAALLVSFLRAQSPPIAPAAPTAPAAPAGSGALVGERFLTGAVEQEVIVDGRTNRRWVPDETKLAFAWSDRPFAIHVPFQMETEVRQLTQYAVPRPGAPTTAAVFAKDYDIRLFLRGFVYTNGSSVTVAQPALLSAGLYRFDGQPVYTERPSKYFWFERNGLINREAYPEATVYPYRANGRPAAASGRVDFFIVVDPRHTPLRRDDQGSVGGGIDSDTWEKHFGEKISGKLEVAIYERSKPSKEVEFEVPIHQNGWLLREPKMEVSGDWSLASRLPTSAVEWRFKDLGTTFKATTVTTRHRMTFRDPTPDAATGIQTTDVEIELQMPPRLFDHLGASGALYARQIAGSNYPASSKYGTQLFGNGGVASFKAFKYSTNSPASAPPVEVDLFPYREIGHGNTWDAMQAGKDKATGRYAEGWRLDVRAAQRGGFSESGDSLNVLIWNWPPGTRIDSHRVFTANVNFYADGGTNQPHKRIDFFATRISDVEDNRAGRTTVEGPTVASDPLDDGYWEWRAEFTELCNKVQTRISSIHGQLNTLLKVKAEVDNRFLWLLELDQAAYPRDPDDARDLVGWAIANPRKAVGVALGTAQVRPPQPTLSKETLAMLLEQRNGLLVTNNLLHAQQKRLLDEAAQLLKSRVTSASIQAPKSIQTRGTNLWTVADTYRDLGQIEQLRLYETAGWLDSDEARAVVDEMKFPETSVKDVALLMSAKAAYARAHADDRKLWYQRISPKPPGPDSPTERMARRERAQAMRDVRESVRLNPFSSEARALLKTVELEFLTIIAGKLDQERKISIDSLHHYLDEHGFYAKDNLTPWETIKEAGSVFFTSFPSVIAIGVTDMKGYVAEAVDYEQTTLAEHEVALMAIQKLRNNGLTLQEIAVVDPKTLGEVITLRRENHQPLDPKSSRAICTDIHQAFAGLPDLAALLNGTPEKIDELLARSYYAAFTPRSTGLEMFANTFFSPQSLACMFGPGVIVKGAEGLQFAVTEGALLENIAAQGVRVEQMSEYLYRGLKIREFGAWLSESDTLMDYLVNPLRNAVQSDAATLRALTTVAEGAGLGARVGAVAATAGNFGARFAATMVIAGGASNIASTHHLGALRVLIEIIALLGAERTGYDLLERSGVPMPKLAEQVEEFAGVVASKEVLLSQVTVSIQSLERIHQRVSAASGVARGLLDEEITAVRSANLLSRTSPALIGGNPEVEMTTAVAAAAQALEQGNAAEAERALAAARALQNGCQEAITEAKEVVSKARVALKNGKPSIQTLDAPHPPAPVVEDPPPVDPPVVPPLAELPLTVPPPRPAPAAAAFVPRDRPPVQISAARLTEPELIVAAGGYDLGTAAGVALKEGDDLVRKGEFTQAYLKFKEALLNAEKAGDEAFAAVFHKRAGMAVSFASEANKVRARMAAEGAAASVAHPATRDLLLDEASEVIAKIKSGEYWMDFQNNSLNPVYFIKDKATGRNLYVFKHLKPVAGAEQKEVEKVADEILAECVGPALLNHLRPMAPASYRIEDLGMPLTFFCKRLEKEVTETGTGVLSRFMENEAELMSLREGALLQLKKEYAFQRVFRAWMGDTDGHLRNVVSLGGGKVGVLDFGYGQVGSKLVLHQNNHELFHDPLEFMEKALYYPQLVWGVVSDNPDAQKKAGGKLYGWINRMDDWLTFDDLQESVSMIKGLCEPGREAELSAALLKSGIRESEVATAIKTLRERGMAHPRTGESALETVLRKRFDPTSANYKPTMGLEVANQYKERIRRETEMKRALDLKRNRGAWVRPSRPELSPDSEDQLGRIPLFLPGDGFASSVVWRLGVEGFSAASVLTFTE